MKEITQLDENMILALGQGLTGGCRVVLNGGFVEIGWRGRWRAGRGELLGAVPLNLSIIAGQGINASLQKFVLINNCSILKH